MYFPFLIFFIFSFSFGYNSYYIFTLSPCFFLFSTHVKDLDHDEEVEKATEFDNEDTNECEESNMND